MLRALLPALLLVCPWMITGQSTPSVSATPFFRIQVVDRDTGRGVPLIELTTTYNAKFVTDSAGVVAFYEPGLMDKEQWFHVQGHGYEHTADGFGFRGLRLTPTSGGQAKIFVDRINIAQRIYRMTGVGIYRDSRLLNENVPLANPDVNGLVAGQDSAHAHIYKGKIYWFWGDTNQLAYPLGNFKTAGATSELPANGGLAPAVGVDLNYFVDGNGFARPMAPIPGSGVVWIEAVASVRDTHGNERMIAHFERRQGLGALHEQGILIWNDATQTFEKAANLPLDEVMHPHGWQPFERSENGVDYLYFTKPYPNLRVPATLVAALDPAQYQGYTPLLPGSRYDGANTQLEKDAQGDLVWAWKADTPPLTPDQQRTLVNQGMFERADSPFRVFDVDSGKQIKEHFGCIAWNDFTQSYLMIFDETGGSSSLLGETFIAQATSPEGPWVHARKIVTHDDYSLYNVAHRPFFSEQGGKIIYFEGTYTRSFSGTQVGTPYYDYNQVMYRLDLSDPRLRAKP